MGRTCELGRAPGPTSAGPTPANADEAAHMLDLASLNRDNGTTAPAARGLVNPVRKRVTPPECAPLQFDSQGGRRPPKGQTKRSDPEYGDSASHKSMLKAFASTPTLAQMVSVDGEEEDKGSSEDELLGTSAPASLCNTRRTTRARRQFQIGSDAKNVAPEVGFAVPSHERSSKAYQQQQNKKLRKVLKRLSAQQHVQMFNTLLEQSALYGSASEIIPGLYLGSAPAAAMESRLLECNVRYIVNCSNDLQNLHEHTGCIKYLRVPVDDNEEEGWPILPYFDRSNSFIEEALANDKCVLVHCLAGVSRSPTVVIAYLMGEKGLCLAQALSLTTAKRGIVKPNKHFMEQLQQYEQQLLTP